MFGLETQPRGIYGKLGILSHSVSFSARESCSFDKSQKQSWLERYPERIVCHGTSVRGKSPEKITLR